jgi:hypothetical protein
VTNAGTLDRTIRIALGIALLSLAWVGPQTPLGWVGIVPLLTGVIGFCPAYRVFGVNTCPVARR